MFMKKIRRHKSRVELRDADAGFVRIQNYRYQSFWERLKLALTPQQVNWTNEQRIQKKEIEAYNIRALFWYMGLIIGAVIVGWFAFASVVILAPVHVAGHCVLADLHAPDVPVKIGEQSLDLVPRTMACDFQVSGSQYAILKVLK